MKMSRYLPLLVAGALALAACNRQETMVGPSQVVATVNGEEISIHQVNRLINDASTNAAPQQVSDSTSLALDRLIDQELLVQKAKEAKLDRDPQVMQAVEALERQVLAQAYLERTLAAADQQNPDETKKFYAENPVLFERRRIYQIRQLEAVVPTDELDLMIAETAQARNIDDVAGWLKAHELAFNMTTSSRPAEEIPFDMLGRISAMKDGEIALFALPKRVSVVQLVGSLDAALSQEQAAPTIEKFLAGRKRVELAERELKQLRSEARIEYVGNFSDQQKSTDSTVIMPPRMEIPTVPAGDEHLAKGLTGLM